MPDDHRRHQHYADGDGDGPVEDGGTDRQQDSEDIEKVLVEDKWSHGDC